MPDRRSFLRGLAAIATTAALAPLPSFAPVLADRARLDALMRTGLVEDQTFVLTDGLGIHIRAPLVMRNCRFIWGGTLSEAVITFHESDPNAAEVVIRDCHFDNTQHA